MKTKGQIEKDAIIRLTDNNAMIVPSTDDLRQALDAFIFDGIDKIGNIVKHNESPDLTIKAFAVLVQASRLVEMRRANEASDNVIEVDDKFFISKAK